MINELLAAPKVSDYIPKGEERYVLAIRSRLFDLKESLNGELYFNKDDQNRVDRFCVVFGEEGENENSRFGKTRVDYLFRENKAALDIAGKGKILTLSNLPLFYGLNGPLFLDRRKNLHIRFQQVDQVINGRLENVFQEMVIDKKGIKSVSSISSKKRRERRVLWSLEFEEIKPKNGKEKPSSVTAILKVPDSRILARLPHTHTLINNDEQWVVESSGHDAEHSLTTGNQYIIFSTQILPFTNTGILDVLDERSSDPTQDCFYYHQNTAFSTDNNSVVKIDHSERKKKQS